MSVFCITVTATDVKKCIEENAIRGIDEISDSFSGCIGYFAWSNDLVFGGRYLNP